MSVKDKLLEAVAKGEAARKATQDEEAEKKAKQEKLHQEWHIEYSKKCDEWVETSLPALFEEAAAKGNDSIYLSTDDVKASACTRAGLKVTTSYVEGWYDEGVHFGDHYVYYVYLPKPE